MPFEYCLDVEDVWHLGDPSSPSHRNLRCHRVTTVVRRTTDLVAVERSKLPWCAACDATLWPWN